MLKQITIKTVFLLLFLIMMFFSLPLCAQDAQVNLNEYYKFLFSFGLEFQSITILNENKNIFDAYEISGNIRYPLPFSPVFQPAFQFGMIQFDSPETYESGRWDHMDFFGQLGIVYAERFSKSFEFNGELLVGSSLAYFPKLFPYGEPVASFNLMAQAGARVCLNASYNFVLDFHPNIKYTYSLSSLHDFDGFILGIGISAHYRFGDDPDAGGKVIRNISFSNVSFQPIFAAMQSYYATHPLGKITITNTENHKLTDLEVSFFQAGFMDSPTSSFTLPEMEPNESIDVDIYALFNQKVFSTEGITPLTGDIIVTYKSKNRPAEQKKSISYDLYDKTSITWDDDMKLAAFITPADSALRNFSSYVRQTCKDDTAPGYNENIQFAMQLFQALGEVGIIYQIDPTSPFAQAKEDTLYIDSVSLPRDTLKRLTGDCDDLTVLFCSLLETVGIETAFITIPGHIYVAFNTNLPGKAYKEIHPDRDMTININDRLWIPVEITMIGKTAFIDAWKQGISEYRAFDGTPEKRAIYLTHKAHETYRPVFLVETDIGLQYGNKERFLKVFNQEKEKVINMVLKDFIKAAQVSGKAKDYNKLGIQYSSYEMYAKAEDSFNKAINIDPRYIAPKINLGNIKYLMERYSESVQLYLSVAKYLEEMRMDTSQTYLKIMLNISKTYYAMEEYNKVKKYFQIASDIDKSAVEEYSYLNADSGMYRAADVEKMQSSIIFIEEDE